MIQFQRSAVPPLYKYIEAQHLDSFFSSGSLRLGTLYSYKDTVEYGSNRGDPSEGTLRVVRHNHGVLPIRKDLYHPVLSEVISMTAEGESYVLGGTFVSERASPDAFLFCTSTIYTESMFIEWNCREHLDACYEIFDVRGFIRAITKVTSSSAFFAFGNVVNYVDARVDYRHPVANDHPALAKLRSDYQWQHEHRLLWPPRMPSTPLKPWIVKVPEARQYCRPIARMIDGTCRYHV